MDGYIDDEVDEFYGYYTIHTVTGDCDILGMLIVNGYQARSVSRLAWCFADIEEKH